MTMVMSTMSTKHQLRERWKVEPGLTIRQKIVDFERPLRRGHGRSSEELFCLLDGLPYRDEVPSGRDFRGNGFVRGREMDFSDADFSFSPTIGDFFQCNLENACFEEVITETTSFGNILNGASFRKAKLRSCFINDSQARNSCFDGASLYHMTFQGSDFSGSSFRNANCRRSSFAHSNLQGCDFRGANLDECVFAETLIDKSTDFRGASLINTFHNDNYDKAGNLLSRGVDLRQATFDETTKFGVDPLAFPLEVNQRAIEVASEHYGADGLRIAAFIKRLTEYMLATGKQSVEWENDQLARLSPHDREVYDRIMEETFKSLL